jgi:Tol biopolymer transport system component
LAAVKEQTSTKRWRWIAVGIAAIAIAAAIFVWWKAPSAVPVVESVTQLTDDGEPKGGRLGTDGSRIYFNEGQTGSWKIAQVSVRGGHSGLIDTRLVNPQVTRLAPDGSALLALVGGYWDNAKPLWSIPFPVGEPRRLGSFELQDADFFPDGRILIAQGRDLYVADRDGSNPRKLVSVAGDVWFPTVSPDGKRIVFALYPPVGNNSLVEIASDGTGFHTILNASQDERLGAGAWTSDGMYLVFRIEQRGESDIWALPLHTGIFHRSREPIRLTNGPLSYYSACPSRDGKQIFAIGTKRRGEVVRYDMQSRQFVPFLSGISAIDPNFSRDGKWVAYSSYPDHTLWRSRSDGSDRRQLTYPPMEVGFPFISPDGTKVVFRNARDEIYVISIDGGQPQKIIESHAVVATWSPDGNRLVVTLFTDAPVGEKNDTHLQIFDLRTGKISDVPSSLGKGGCLWVTQDALIAPGEGAMLTYDFKTQKWGELVAGSNFVNSSLSPDHEYFYFTTGGAAPKAQRLRLADRQIETITSLKDLRRVVDRVEFGTQISVAPDGSPVFTRDIGTQEIYALNVKWP